MKLKIFGLITVIILIFSIISSASTCVGCATGTYTEIHNVNQTNSTNFTIAQTLNASVFTSSIMSVTDAKINISGIYGSVNRSDLVGWWTFDENAGIYVNDSSDSNNNGTWEGNNSQNWTTGKYNTAGNFSFSNRSYVNISNVSNHINYTQSVWIYITVLSTQSIIQTDDGGIETTATGIYYNSWNGRNGSATSKVNTHVGDISLNNWYNIVVTAENTSSLKLYVNGTLKDTSSHSDTPSSGYTDDVIGVLKNDVGTTSGYFNGTIDDVKIYNRSLSPEEIRQQYLVGIQQLQAKYTTNSTYSENLNGTSSVSVPYLFGESYSALQWLIPENITDPTGITCYNCSQQMQFIPTLTVNGIENTTNISITTTLGYQTINYSWTPANSYNTSWINFTVPDLGAAGYGAAILDNTTNRTLYDNYPSFNISQTNITAGQTYYYNITKPYTDLTLSGIVTNEAGQAISDVSVTVLGTTLTTSDAFGNYLTGDVFLHSSSYSVTYSKTGYNPQTIIVTFNLANVNQNVVLQRTPLQLHTDTCSGIKNYSDIAIPLFGLTLMILAFSVIFITLKSQTLTAPLLITTMMIAIVGFGLILVGNYLLYAIYGVTC